MKKILNYIDGNFSESINGQWIDNYSPVNGNVYSLIPKSNEADINKAVVAAKMHFQNGGILERKKDIII